MSASDPFSRPQVSRHAKPPSMQRAIAPIFRSPPNVGHRQNPNHVRPLHMGDVVRKHPAIDTAITLCPQRRNRGIVAHPRQGAPHLGPETLPEPRREIVISADLPRRSPVRPPRGSGLSWSVPLKTGHDRLEIGSVSTAGFHGLHPGDDHFVPDRFEIRRILVRLLIRKIQKDPSCQRSLKTSQEGSNQNQPL